MKKNLLIIALMAGILSAFTGCYNDDDFTELETNTTTAVTTTAVTEATTAAETTVAETETKAPEETTTVTEKETEKQNTADTEKQTTVESENSAETKDDINTKELKETAYKLFEKYNTVDHLLATAVMQTRDDYIVDGKNRTYNHVTDESFTCVDDIRKFIDGCLTGNAKFEIEDALDLDGGHAMPIYMDVDGQLYCLDGGRGCGFDFVKDSLVISDVTETAFTAKITSSNVAVGDVFLTAQIELKDGTWLISCIEKTF